METVKHWTSNSIDDLAFRIGFDFVAQLESKLEEEGTDRKAFAKKAKVSAGRISQVFNTPNNLRVTSLVQYASAAGMGAAIVAYELDDPDGENGPIPPEVFRRCWERAGRPKNMFELSAPAEELKQDLRFYRSQNPGLSVTTNVITGSMVVPPKTRPAAEQSFNVFTATDKAEQRYA